VQTETLQIVDEIVARSDGREKAADLRSTRFTGLIKFVRHGQRIAYARGFDTLSAKARWESGRPSAFSVAMMISFVRKALNNQALAVPSKRHGAVAEGKAGVLFQGSRVALAVEFFNSRNF
jgi:hypothetical protein